MPSATQIAIANAMMHLPAPLMRRLAGPPIEVDGKQMDLKLQWMLKLAAKQGRPPMQTLTPDEARQEYRVRGEVFGGRKPEMARLLDRLIPGPAGDIPVRLYVPHTAPEKAPVIVFYHGGGWVIGDLETHDTACRHLAVESGCIVLSVDYRLAPEHKFPAAVEDAVAAYEWTLAHAAELDGDPARVAVGGDSAGGNLAAVVCQKLRETGGQAPAFQLLIYPATDFRANTRSHDVYGKDFVLTTELMEYFQGHYLNGSQEKEDVMASPLLAADLSGLPPAWIGTAGFDPLQDEAKAYAKRLREAGVAVEETSYDGMVHGFMTLTGAIDDARRMFRDMGAYVKARLAA
jgi:acetyl esterase